MSSSNNGSKSAHLQKATALGTVYRFDPKRIQTDELNPRKRFRRIAELAESIKATGQTTPGKVTRIEGDPKFDAKLIDGERRLRACLLADVPFEAYLDEQTISPAKRLSLAVAANFNQSPHDRMEVAHALQNLKEAYSKEGDPLSNKQLGSISTP
jgi:ParB/RepB/Spo0J family partition protein